jgi:hypothetical protein
MLYLLHQRQYSQEVRRWIANPLFPSSILGTVLKWDRGGMVDTTDLKSVD